MGKEGVMKYLKIVLFMIFIVDGSGAFCVDMKWYRHPSGLFKVKVPDFYVKTERTVDMGAYGTVYSAKVGDYETPVRYGLCIGIISFPSPQRWDEKSISEYLAAACIGDKIEGWIIQGRSYIYDSKDRKWHLVVTLHPFGLYSRFYYLHFEPFAIYNVWWTINTDYLHQAVGGEMEKLIKKVLSSFECLR